MQQARRRNLTSSQIMRLEQAPDTIAFLQEEINQVINKLGSDRYRDLHGVSGK
jgi:hypothetical protein